MDIVWQGWNLRRKQGEAIGETTPLFLCYFQTSIQNLTIHSPNIYIGLGDCPTVPVSSRRWAQLGWILFLIGLFDTDPDLG